MIREAYSLLRTIYAHPYNRRRPLFALYRLARWQAHKRLHGGPRVYPFWGTRRVACYPDSQSSMWLVYNYYMDWEEFDFIRKYVRGSDTVFDVGANIGVYTMWLSQFTDRICSFEPDPENYRRCMANIRLNGLNVRLEQMALSERTGTVHFSTGKDMENHLVLGAGGQRARAITLDDYCAQRGIARIGFMKIDVEGAELLAFRGATSLLARHAIDVIQLELAPHSLVKFGIRPDEVVRILAGHGYSLYTYDHELRALDDRHPQNIYAVADIQAVRSRLAGDRVGR